MRQIGRGYARDVACWSGQNRVGGETCLSVLCGRREMKQRGSCVVSAKVLATVSGCVVDQVMTCPSAARRSSRLPPDLRQVDNTEPRRWICVSLLYSDRLCLDRDRAIAQLHRRCVWWLTPADTTTLKPRRGRRFRIATLDTGAESRLVSPSLPRLRGRLPRRVARQPPDDNGRPCVVGAVVRDFNQG